MEDAGPPVVLLDEWGRIVHLTAAAGRFLTFSTGEVTRDLLEAVHPALRNSLCAALERARLSQRPEVAPGLTLHLGGELLTVHFHASPLREILPGHLLVTIEAHPSAPSGRDADASEAQRFRSQFHDLAAQHAAAVERHQAYTEELQTVNEELRVATEELESHREELQTLNQELTAANHTLTVKIDELGHANSDLQNLMAATAIATVFLDREGRITRYTPAAAPLFHLVESDVGRPLADLRHRLDYGELEADAARVLAHLRPVEREIGGNGGEWFLVRLRPYRTGDDRIAGVVLTCVNITERKQAEAHRQAKDAAERISRARSEFLSRMSHELRTPLNAILGFGQILELGSRDEQDTMALGLILKAGRHLLALVDEVLDLTRAESGNLRLTFGRVDLGQLARECLQLIAKLAAVRGVVCEVEDADGPFPLLWTDEHRLRQALLNLLTNAVKYNHSQGRVTLACRREADGQCRISVRDPGCGIAAADLPKLFTPFERLHHHDGEIEGTGLGLAITRQTVEALGGTVGVESEPGRGSRFWIKLPIGSLPAALADENPVPPLAAQAILARRDVTLLCIEDNASNLELVQTVAARHWPHWRFVSARDGRMGLEQARRHAPKLILLDLQLPDHPGDWVMAELRRDPRTVHLPVVVLSADATARSREKLLAAGAAEFLTKPFRVSDLVQVVERTLHASALSS